jgi:hypothetical protein
MTCSASCPFFYDLTAACVANPCLADGASCSTAGAAPGANCADWCCRANNTRFSLLALPAVAFVLLVVTLAICVARYRRRRGEAKAEQPTVSATPPPPAQRVPPTSTADKAGDWSEDVLLFEDQHGNRYRSVPVETTRAAASHEPVVDLPPKEEPELPPPSARSARSFFSVPDATPRGAAQPAVAQVVLAPVTPRQPQVRAPTMYGSSLPLIPVVDDEGRVYGHVQEIHPGPHGITIRHVQDELRPPHDADDVPREFYCSSDEERRSFDFERHRRRGNTRSHGTDGRRSHSSSRASTYRSADDAEQRRNSSRHSSRSSRHSSRSTRWEEDEEGNYNGRSASRNRHANEQRRAASDAEGGSRPSSAARSDRWHRHSNSRERGAWSWSAERDERRPPEPPANAAADRYCAPKKRGESPRRDRSSRR